MSYSVARWLLNRLFEWVMTLALFGLVIHVILVPRALEASAFRYVEEVAGFHYLLVAFMVIGWFSVLALLANGHWPIWGPRIRAIGSLSRALVWLQLDFALIRLIPEVGTPPSPGIPVYFALFLGEIIATFMAATDDRARIR